MPEGKTTGAIRRSRRETTPAIDVARPQSALALNRGFQASNILIGGDFDFLPALRTCNCPPRNLNCLSRAEVNALGSTILNVETRHRWKEKHGGRFIPELPEKFIKLLSHRGECVLDPFCGSGTTNLVAYQLGRHSVGIDVNPQSVELAHQRLQDEFLRQRDESTEQRLIAGSVLDVLPQLPEGAIDLTVTSPPYFDVVDYENGSAEQWGNMHSYENFLERMVEAFSTVFRVTRPGGFLVVNTQDVFKRDHKCPMHADYVWHCRRLGFEVISTQVYVLNFSSGGRLVWGYPAAYYPKNDHEYMLVFRKPTAPEDGDGTGNPAPTRRKTRKHNKD